jgi:hypothetical protein
MSPIPLGYPNPADQRTQPDAIQAQAEADNVGKRQEAPAKPGAVTPPLANVGKRKTPADLLELIPGESPIQQASLFEAARAAGINQKYARQFLGVLIVEKRVLVQKMPRDRAKSALGYVRTPPTPQPRPQDAAEELSLMSCSGRPNKRARSGF